MNLALFDFDGTITHTDSFAPFIRFSVPAAKAAIGYMLLAPIIAGYKCGFVSASKARSAIVRRAFRGRRVDEARQLGSRYATDILPQMIRRKAIDRIDWHRSQGDRIVVVSAALDLYLPHWCAANGLDVICTELEEQSGVLTGEYRGGDCVGREKVRRICMKVDLEEYSAIYAYGDTSEDAEMIGMATHKFFRWSEMSGPVIRTRRSDHVDQHPLR